MYKLSVEADNIANIGEVMEQIKDKMKAGFSCGQEFVGKGEVFWDLEQIKER